MLIKGPSGLSVPNQLNFKFFPELMSFIDLVALTSVEFIPDHDKEELSSQSSKLDNEAPKEAFKAHLIYFLSQRISFLKSIGLAFMHVHNKTLDKERVFSVIDFIRKPDQLQNHEMIDNLLNLSVFNHSDSELRVLSSADIEIYLGITNTDQVADINIEFDILVGALIIIRTLKASGQLDASYHAAELFIKLITNSKRAIMPSGFNMEDMIHMLKSSKLGKTEIVNTISKFGFKQKAFLPLLDSYLFKISKNNKTLLYPISVGCSDFNDAEKMSYSLKQLQYLPFNGQYIFFVSDTWQKFIYNAKASFKNIFEGITPSSEQQKLIEDQFETIATNEGQIWLEANSDLINQLNQQQTPFLTQVGHTQKPSKKIFDGADNSTLLDASYLINSNNDKTEDHNRVNRVEAPRCDHFDPATNYLEVQSKDITASIDFFDTYPSLAFPEPVDPFSLEETLPQIRAFQLAYFIFLYGKLIYLDEIINQDQVAGDCKDIEKFLFPTNLLSKEELTKYTSALRNHLREYACLMILKNNLSFFSGAKKIFQHISLSSAKMLTKSCMTMKKNELTRYIFDSRERTISFYSAQQESCKYAIFTMGMMIYFSYTYNLGNQCYPGQIDGWWDELNKINHELKKECLGSALFRNPSRSVAGTPERMHQAHTTPPESENSTKGNTTDRKQSSDGASPAEYSLFTNLLPTKSNDLNHTEQSSQHQCSND